jgi:hypothetical protein
MRHDSTVADRDILHRVASRSALKPGEQHSPIVSVPLSGGFIFNRADDCR